MVLVVLLILLLAFIWGNSCLPVRFSARESGTILNLIRPFLERFVGEGNVTDHLVRKLAHFAEFTALGLVIGLLVQSGRRFRLQPVVFSLVMGLLAAFADESIQMFSDRGDQIIDVWLDFSGVTLGVALACLLLALRRQRRRKKMSGETSTV